MVQFIVEYYIYTGPSRLKYHHNEFTLRIRECNQESMNWANPTCFPYVLRYILQKKLWINLGVHDFCALYGNVAHHTNDCAPYAKDKFHDFLMYRWHSGYRDWDTQCTYHDWSLTSPTCIWLTFSTHVRKVLPEYGLQFSWNSGVTFIKGMPLTGALVEL
jgi:hypothetical protein